MDKSSYSEDNLDHSQSSQNCSLEDKLIRFLKLPKSSHSLFEDDTVMQKLQSAMFNYIQNLENSLVWCEQIELLKFISETLEETSVRSEKNYAALGLALHSLSAIVAKEEVFLPLSDMKLMKNFKQSIPHLRENMSLASSSLKVVDSLITHSAGIDWIAENGLWEALLICSIKCQSLFVRKDCISVITTLLLNVKDSQRFANYIHDLELILYKFRETRCHLREHLKESTEEHQLAASIAMLRFNTKTVLLVFYSVLKQSLGKISLYRQLKEVLDLTSKILFSFNFEMSSESVIELSKILLLSTLHRFQEQILKFGTVEQYQLDSITTDLLSLTRHMMNKGLHLNFLLASFKIHEYWSIMCKNIKERNDAELSKCESILFVLLRFQILPLRIVCSSSLDMGTEEERTLFEDNYATWKRRYFAKMCIREEQKIEMTRLVEVLKEKFAGDLKRANEQCIAHLNHFTIMIDYIQPKCGSTLLQALLFLLKFKIEVTSAMDCNPRFYLQAINLLKLLIERFEVDWEDYFEFNSLLFMICSVVWIPGITTRVKVCALQTIGSCIKIFVPAAVRQLYTRPISTEQLLIDIKFDKLAQTLTIYLSDTEWEVRDTALEVILICLNIHEQDIHPVLEQRPFFDWFVRFGLLNLVLQAVGDIEPFVQATALAILAASLPHREIWPKLKDQGIKQKAIRAVAKSGESCIRKAGLELVEALLLNSKFEPAEIKKVVIPVVQSASSDPDDEIRLTAVKLIGRHLHLDLLLMGMIDGEFPKVTFQNGKITNLQEKEVQERILKVICSFNNNGYFQSVLNCTEDKAENVMTESKSIISCIGKLVKKYEVQDNLATCLNGSESPSEINVTEIRSNIDEMEADIISDSETMTPAENLDIDYVLETSDLSVISRLNKVFSDCDNWWSGESLENILNENEIPTPFTSVSSSTVFEVLENAETATLPADKVEESKQEILNLLDDIFLVTGSSSEQNESRSRDCY